jgi:hypothetical protein
VRGSVVANSNSTVSPATNAYTVSRLTITGALTLKSGSTLNMNVDYYNYMGYGTNDLIDGLASVTYGGTLNLNVYSIDPNSVIKLFNAASYHGAFESISPSTPPGLTGMMWDTSHLAVDGTLRVAPQRPGIASITLAGTDLVFSGANGSPYATYYVLTSTNVAVPLSGWVPIATNTFNYDGTFNFTNPVSTTTRGQFFLLQQVQ